MAKLTKNSKSNRPGATTPSSNKQGNPTLIIGIILAVGVGLLFFLFATNLQKTENIVVAKADIPAFSSIQKDQVEVVSVPADSVGTTDLTEATYNQYVAKGTPIVNRVEILPGQRIDTNAISASSLGSLAVVKTDEQVVAVSTTFTGAAAAVIVPGSVVDVYSSSGDNTQPLVTQAKVLGVGVGTQAASGVRPDSKVKDSGSGTDIVVLLAVKSSDAGKLLTHSQVSLSYNPHKAFDVKGNICDIGKCATTIANPTTTQPSTAATGLDSSVTGTTPTTTPQTSGAVTAPQTTTPTTPGG
jgi:Flp pilus assembly protein CpaB